MWIYWTAVGIVAVILIVVKLIQANKAFDSAVEDIAAKRQKPKD